MQDMNGFSLFEFGREEQMPRLDRGVSLMS